MKRIPELIMILSTVITVGLANSIIVPDMVETIQSAVDASVSGDTVLVQPGVYHENITVSGKNIILCSLFLITGDPSYIDSTIIDGSYSGSAIVFDSFINTAAQLSGFTITHGSGSMTCNGAVAEGGGIYCTQASPRLSDLIITGNQIITNDTLVSRGGGIACNMASPVLTNISLYNNSHSGVYLSNYSSPVFHNVEIFDNSQEGLICSFYSNPELSDVLIANNGSTGIKCVNDSSPTIINVTVAGHPGYGISVNNSTVTLINSILWYNSPTQLFVYAQGNAILAYSDIQEGAGGITTMSGNYEMLEANIDTDPVFADPEGGDYSLQVSSGCIDMGTNFFELNGDTLIDLSDEDYFGFYPDPGCYEFGTPPGLLGDVNYDGTLNVVDVVTLVGVIVESNPTNYQLWAGDMNLDGLVNVVDIVALVNEILGN
ncbi:MAG: hypothetical protein GXO91_06900 [FCB group bacterium]|nr:hypothetical protein [FCB group bacterium]